MASALKQIWDVASVAWSTISSLPPTRVIMAGSLAIPILWATFAAISAFYNIHLHPLAKFPGPQAACLSQKWVLAQSKTGRAEEVFERLHKQYGIFNPILRRLCIRGSASIANTSVR